MRRLMFLAGVVLLMVLAMAVDSTPAAPAAGIAVDPASGAVFFGGTQEEPAITSSPVPKH